MALHVAVGAPPRVRIGHRALSPRVPSVKTGTA